MVSSSHIRTGVSAIVTAVAVAYLVLAVRSNWIALSTVEWRPGLGTSAALVLFVLAVPATGILWNAIVVELCGSSPGIAQSIVVHTESWLLKYVPGQVAGLARKLAWGKAHALASSSVAASLTYDFLFHLCASVAIGLPVVLLVLPDVGGSYTSLLGLVVIVQVAILGVPLLVKVLPPTIQRRLSSNFLRPAFSLRMQLLYLVPRLLNAVGFVLLASRLGAVDGFRGIISVGAVYVLAGIIGILAFLVPSGLGVREAVITVLLAPSIGEANALGLAAVARIVAVAADVVLVTVVVGLRTWLVSHAGELASSEHEDREPEMHR